MLKTTLHCDGCTRTRADVEVGWFLVQDVIEARVLDREGHKLGVDRALVLRDIKLGELPTQGKAVCGVECLTRMLHTWTELVLREQAERKV